MADYLLAPIPPDLQGPSGEANQVQLDGIVQKVALFHGRSDEELDWHIYFAIDPNVARNLGQQVRDAGHSIDDASVIRPYCELMVIDDWHRRGPTWPPWQASFQRKYDSADVTRPLRLVKAGSAHAAYDLAREVADEPGDEVDLSLSSQLVWHAGRVYMQGVMVLDTAHSPNRLEIHPPDSITFAIGDNSQTLSITETDTTWPERAIRWRVAWFSNSGYHRVNGLRPLKQERTTTWYLPLPGRVVDRPHPPIPPLPTTQTHRQFDITTETIRLWNSKSDEWYEDRGVESIDEARLEVDPRDRRLKLRVNATMSVPGERGGLIVRDYIVRVKPDVVSPIS